MVVEPTHLKNMSQNGFIFPNFRGETKNYLKPPPSCRCFSIDMLVFWRVLNFQYRKSRTINLQFAGLASCGVLHPKYIKYTLGSTNIAGWKMDPDWVDVFPYWKWRIYSSQLCYVIIYQRVPSGNIATDYPPCSIGNTSTQSGSMFHSQLCKLIAECNTGRFQALGHPTSPAIFACAWGHHYDHGSEFSAPRRPGAFWSSEFSWVEQWRKP